MRELVCEARMKFRDENDRLTRQREAIFDVLARQPRVHFTAQKIHDVTREQHQMGLSTVYRTLAILQEIGLIRKLDVGDGVSRYEFDDGDTSPHCHLVCLRCGGVMEASCPPPEEMQVILRADRFKIYDQSMVFFRLCQLYGTSFGGGWGDSVDGIHRAVREV